MTEFRYYEKIASRLFDIDPKDLSKVSRDPNIINARNLCIYYRFKVLNFGRTASTKRYGKKHSTSYNCIKNVENYCFTNKYYKQIFDNFMRECSIYLKSIEDDINLRKDTAEEIRNQLNGIIKHFIKLQNGLCDYVIEFEHDETYYIELLDPCIRSVNELKTFFRYDDNKRDLGNQRTRVRGTKGDTPECDINRDEVFIL